MDCQLITDYKKETHAPFTDSLTGLFNHGFFQISLEREVKRSLRYGVDFILGLIDIDSFSTYNKQNGPIQADRILREIAKLIKNNIRQTDLAARYSNDTFAIILLTPDDKSVSFTAERIRSAVYNLYDGKPTVSIGLASFPEGVSNKEGLIKKANKALAQAKIRGKNKVHIFEKETLPPENIKHKVLLISSQPNNQKELNSTLKSLNCQIFSTCDYNEAIYITNKTEIDLIFLEIQKISLNAFELCRRLKGGRSTRFIPVMMISSDDDVAFKKNKIKGINAGADSFISQSINKIELHAKIKSLINIKTLKNNLTSIKNVLISLANIVEAKDAYTQGHVNRVSNMAMALAKKMGLSEEKKEAIRLGGVLHDIGKIGIPSEIINKPGPLNYKEWEIMKKHPLIGYKICLPLKRTIGPALDIIQQHHEKLNGSGYPDGLKEEDISTVSRIMATVDIYDALVTDRPYRKKMSKDKALSILWREAMENKLRRDVVNNLIEMIKEPCCV